MDQLIIYHCFQGCGSIIRQNHQRSWVLRQAGLIYFGILLVPWSWWKNNACLDEIWSKKWGHVVTYEYFTGPQVVILEDRHGMKIVRLEYWGLFSCIPTDHIPFTKHDSDRSSQCWGDSSNVRFAAYHRMRLVWDWSSLAAPRLYLWLWQGTQGDGWSFAVAASTRIVCFPSGNPVEPW